MSQAHVEGNLAELDYGWLNDMDEWLDELVGEKPIPSEEKVITSEKKSWAKKVWQSSITGMVFYILLATVVVLGLMFQGPEDGIPRDFFGYSGMTVLTRSMQSEIPQGSFILTRNVDPSTLNIGDDITYMRSADRTFTHRIVGIYENFADTGARGFQTQGVDNVAPDAEIVIADNVIGRVVFQSRFIGQFLGFVRNHLLLSGLLVVLTFGLFFGLRLAFPTKRSNSNKFVRVNRTEVLSHNI